MTAMSKRKMLIGAGIAGTALAAGAGYLASRSGGALVRPGVGRARSVQSDPALPPQVDTVVIGGGIIGMMAALTLAERGQSVALCEKGVIAGEASGRSLGYVDGLFLDPIKMPIIARAKHLWAGMDERVGAPTGYRRCGLATLLPNAADVEGARGWLDAVQGAPGVDAQVLTGARAAAFTPDGGSSVAGVLHQPGDGVAEPQLAVPAMADALRKRGGIILQSCAARGFERTGGRITAVVTERGTVRCGAVVLAGGVWSSLMARSLGLDLPQFMAFGSVLRLGPVPGPDTALISAEHGIVMRRNHLGGYDLCNGKGTVPITLDVLANLLRLRPAMRAMWNEVSTAFSLDTFQTFARMPRAWALDRPSPFEAHRILMPEIRQSDLDHVLRHAPRAFPFLAGAPIVESWAGSLMTTPDNMPVISPVDAVPGLFVGAGFYYGLTMGPAAGEALADLVTGTAPQFDLAPYRLERFSDGSPIQFRM